ncbi:hypothetical protein [Pseudaestuariivita atlantica]|uniref:hypothetical protein n=1 Tax=Pseudaestuariivita atlantica TaxID=1317121 RepID=UPI001A93D5F0|nr:hypothetical protein [Pseudaestuariivita atlantica]
MARKSKELSKADQRKLKLRDQIWPDAEEIIWNYKDSPGWLNIPRTMPAITRILDALTKGQPVSGTYLELWCRTFNDGFVDAARSGEMAFFSGFDGERAYRTWLSRIRSLEALGFIRTSAGASGEINYLLILNPYPVLLEHYKAGRINARYWNAFTSRLIEIGATDLDDYFAPNTEH